MFFIIFFSIYTIGNFYLFIRGWQSLEMMGRQRVWFAVIFWVVALSFIFTQMLQMRTVSGVLPDIFFRISSFWIAVMLYGFLMLFTIDIVRIIGWAGNIRPELIYRNYLLTKAVMFGMVCLIMTVILTAGYSNAHRPRATCLKIPIDKTAGQMTGLRVVMVSDIHLGHITGRRSLARIVDAMNEQHPDIAFLVGDTFDGAIGEVINKDMGAEFDRLQTVYGTYMVGGNHEYIGERMTKNAKDAAFDYLKTHGVQPLLDSVVLMNGSFYVVGRMDASVRARKTIPELLEGIDRQLPVIMLDHQPFHLDLVEQAGVDLQLSGHTHHGQMWPLNYVTRRLYEIDWGLLQKGKSNFYISCGVGTWGPPIRNAGRSEVVVIDLEFN